VRILKLFRLLLLVALLISVIESRASVPLNEIPSLTNVTMIDGNEDKTYKDPLSASPNALLLFGFNYIFLSNIKPALALAYTNPLLLPNLRPPCI
jgi:hypothetical protein